MSKPKKPLVNILHNENAESLNALDILTKKLYEEGYTYTTNPSNNAFVNICIGGDGAFLRAVHSTNLSNIPYLGINTGHLGFFQEILPHEIDYLVDSLSTGNYRIEKIDLIEAKIISDTEIINALAVNEFAIKGIANKVIHVDVYIDHMLFEKISGDGVIVSSPIGSTGYNYSCGGSIISPQVRAMQVTSIAPITSKAYRGLNNSLILPAESSLIIRPESKDEIFNIISDGIQYTHDGVTEIKFSYSDKTLNKMTIKKKSFWKNVKEKFL